MSEAELTLETQLKWAGIPFVREALFAQALGRRWRADFEVWSATQPVDGLLVEIEGGAYIPGGGRHTRGAGFEADLEKYNAATVLGFRILRFSPAMVEDGRALSVIEAALGLPHKAEVAG